MLISYVILCLVRQPSAADAIIVSGLVICQMWKAWLDHNKLPDIRAEVAADLERKETALIQIKQDLESALISRDAVLRDLESKINSINFQQRTKAEVKNIRF
jgi:hypothetical protein